MLVEIRVVDPHNPEFVVVVPSPDFLPQKLSFIVFGGIRGSDHVPE